MSRRIYRLNHDFFANGVVDEATAYVAGFHAADGHATKHVLRFLLSEKDYAHLELIRDVLQSDCPITRRDVVSFGKPTRMARLTVCSLVLCRDIGRMGLGGRKTDRCVPPPMRPELRRHFFRGVVDGDGTVCAKRNSISLCGNEQMTKAFSAFVSAEVEHPYHDPIRRRRNGQLTNCWEVAYGGAWLAPRVAKLLYGDCTVSLGRKREAALKVMEAKSRLRDWSYLTSEQVRAAVGDGSNVKRSARTLGMSGQTLRSICGRMGIALPQRRTPTAGIDARTMEELMTRFGSTARVAEHLGVNHAAVSQRRKLLGLRA